MGKEKNLIIIQEKYYLTENIKMGKEMEKVKNIIMEN